MRRLTAVVFLAFIVRGAMCQPLGLDTLITSYAGTHAFNGTVSIALPGGTVYRHSFGLADRAFDVPMSNDTKFKIASITKAFTSVLILQLLDKGEIDLSRTVKRYLPDYAGEGADRVTIEMLLHHTSGIDNTDKVKSYEEAATKGMEMYQLPHSSDDLLAKYCSGTLVHEPGKVFDYSNGDYIILGKIIERITGKTFDEQLREQMLRPLGMDESGVAYQRNIVRGLAPTYFLRDTAVDLINDLPVFPENWYAAGAMYSSAADLHKFAAALFNGRLLTPETLKRMLTPGLDNYGYGVWINDYRAGSTTFRAVKRPGSVMGAQAMLFHVLDRNLTIILLANTNEANLDDFCYQISAWIVTH